MGIKVTGGRSRADRIFVQGMNDSGNHEQFRETISFSETKHLQMQDNRSESEDTKLDAGSKSYAGNRSNLARQVVPRVVTQGFAGQLFP